MGSATSRVFGYIFLKRDAAAVTREFSPAWIFVGPADKTAISQSRRFEQSWMIYLSPPKLFCMLQRVMFLGKFMLAATLGLVGRPVA